MSKGACKVTVLFSTIGHRTLPLAVVTGRHLSGTVP